MRCVFNGFYQMDVESNESKNGCQGKFTPGSRMFLNGDVEGEVPNV